MLFSSRKLEHASPSSCTRVCRERVSFKVDANTAATAGVDLNNPDHDMHVEKEAHCRRDGGGNYWNNHTGTFVGGYAITLTNFIRHV